MEGHNQKIKDMEDTTSNFGRNWGKNKSTLNKVIKEWKQMEETVKK